MEWQHRELHYRLDDAEKLQLYAQSTTPKHHALKKSQDKAKSQFKHLERKAKKGTEKMKGAKEERNRAREEAQVARIDVVATGDAKARAEEAKRVTPQNPGVR